MQNPHQIPEELLQRLNEWTSMGFCLFALQDHGIDSYMYVDNEIARLGLQSHMHKLVSAQESIEEQMVFGNLMEGMEQEVKATKKRRKKGGEGQEPA